jgi:hypothetical protein
MKKVSEKKEMFIDSTELANLRELTSKMNDINSKVGEIELYKSGLISDYHRYHSAMNNSRQELQVKYGAISVDLNDGSYSFDKTEESNE